MTNSPYLVIETLPNYPFNGEWNEVQDDKWLRIVDNRTKLAGLGAYKTKEALDWAIRRKYG